MDHPDVNRYFNYDDARAFCAEHGLFLIESWLDGPDDRFQEVELSQEQVNVIMREHIWQIKHLFDPKTYTFKQRVGLAMKFLFG